MHKELKLDAATRLAILLEVKKNLNWLKNIFKNKLVLLHHVMNEVLFRKILN